MATSIGEGLSSPAIEQDPGIAQIQAQQLGAQSAQQQVSLPATGFVSTVNGEDGAITIQPGSSSPGVTVVVTNGLGTISIGVTGFGSIVTHNQGVAVVNSAIVAGAAYSQTDFQAVIDKLNELLGALRTAGIIAP